jgi:group II intron reverse transcriptase/maturase
MSVERSERRQVDRFKLKPQACADGPFKGYFGLDRISSVAVRDRSAVFSNLIHHVNEENLAQAFRGLDGTKAVGSDHVTKRMYGQNLCANIEALTEKIRRGGWRPQPSREVLIPKPSGGMRPLAIGCLEDKIVQTLVAKILEAIYEPRFHRHSYGFRPRRSAHQALARVYSAIKKRGKHTVVVEMDIEKFFNHIDHDKMMNMLKERISDQHLLRLIRRMLRNSILSSDGSLIDNETGTPQGSPVSPILANIYLHHVLDEWFDENYIAKGDMVRYADDAVFIFDDIKVAERFQAAMTERFASYGLRLNADKSSTVELKPRSSGQISLVGFALYWGRTRLRGDLLRVKTLPERFSRAVQNFQTWIKQARNRLTTKELWARIAARLRGHFNYYAVSFNQQAYKFYFHCIRLTFKWLNRRSQKRSYTWQEFARKLMFNPLPKPPLGQERIDITSEYGTELKHKTKSRVRKLRTHGSVRSSGRQRSLFT